MKQTILKCNECKKIVAVVNGSACDTICCGQPMKELVAGTTDAAVEKHVPVYEVADNKISVKVGEVEHPMTEAHLIEWISVETTKGVQYKYLTATDKPEAVFAITEDEEVVAVYAYCNLHGLWKAV